MGLATVFGVDERPSAITPDFPAGRKHGTMRVVAKVRLNANGFKRIGASKYESSNVLTVKVVRALALECQSIRTHGR